MGGDLTRAVEEGSGGGVQGEGQIVDWKRAFRDLSRLMSRIKKLVITAGNFLLRVSW